MSRSPTPHDHLSEIDGYAYSELEREADMIKEEFKAARDESDKKSKEVAKLSTMKDAVKASGETVKPKAGLKYPLRLNSGKSSQTLKL